MSDSTDADGDEPDADLDEFEEAVRRVLAPNLTSDPVVPDPAEWTPEQVAKLRHLATEPDPNDN